MKYMKCNFLTFAFVLFTGWFNLSIAQDDAIPVDKILAKIDNQIILMSDVEKVYQQMLVNGEFPSDKHKAKCQILQELITGKVMYAKAIIDSVEVDDGQVRQEMDRRMDYFILQAGSQEKLEQTLGTTVSELRDDLYEQVKEQMTIETMQQGILAEIQVTPQQVEGYYNSIPKDSIPFLASEVKVGQIVINPEVSKEEKEKVQGQLIDIKDRIIGGEDFGQLAKTYSQDYGSARKGGDLGWHGRGELVPEFEESALTMEINEISEPIESDFGYHLIQLLERRGGRFRARHILIRPKSNYTDLQRAENEVDSVRKLIMSDSLSFEFAVKDYSDDQMTRANAGYFKNNVTGSSYMSIDDLDPTIFFTIDTMKVGQFSKPLKYRMEDGTDAVRIIYLNDKRAPHYANMKDDYQKLSQAALNSRKQDIFMEWLKKAKRDVYIKINDEYADCLFTKDL